MLLSRGGDAQLRAAPMSIPAAANNRARRSRLVVVGVEVGGFGTETVQLLRLRARHKAATVPASRAAAITAWVACWSGLLAVATQRAHAASFLELPPTEALCDSPVPELREILAETRWTARTCPGCGRASSASDRRADTDLPWQT